MRTNPLRPHTSYNHKLGLSSLAKALKGSGEPTTAP